MSARIGYHCSHEQFAPEDLLRLVGAAEAAGFQAAMSADHFQPWSLRQGQSGHSWTWLGAAMHATALPFGALCIPGGWRYHPAIAAQAAATLARLFPGRLSWLAAGSGEALNERVVGRGWPAKDERNARLKAGVEIMRALWAGETVSCQGPIPTEQARLFTRPETPPQVYGAALTPETAEWMGAWADGLITVNADHQTLFEIIEAFRQGGGEGKPLVLQAHLSFAESDEAARAAAHDQWRTNAVPPLLAAALATPEAYDAAAEHVRPEDMDRHVLISADPARHADAINEHMQLGLSEIYLHNVGRNQEAFIEAFGAHVLPRVGAA